MNEFDALAAWYDAFSDPDYYSAYADFVNKTIRERSKIPVADILDLGCGTCRLSVLLEKLGYSMVCVDRSAQMLSHARNASSTLLLIEQDITAFELYGTVQCVVSTLDTLNYLLTYSELEKVFALVANYLESGGLFIFDVNTPYRFSTVYGNNSFVYERGGDMFVWQNADSARRHVMDLTLFTQRRDGMYERFDERQIQRSYDIKKLSSLLDKAQLKVTAIYGGTDFCPLGVSSEKAYFVTEKKGKQ
ncbi:MAG TPA: class I SAM-dependent methyltransferase [Bacillota bacterium]|nr:class I SAM-dependent methyltransferase [Bacillota bacterium]